MKHTKSGTAPLDTAQGILKTVFGHNEFRPLQEDIIKAALAGSDVLAVMPTGGGKSLCYQVPALLLPGLTLVVSPLIALMQDQVAALRSRGVQAVFLNSSLNREDYFATVDALRSGTVKLLYLAPETLVSDRVQQLLDEQTISLFTIDEAHCISEWGHDFRPEYRQIAAVRARYPKAACLALTATATAQVRADITKTLRLTKERQYIASFNRRNIFLEVRPRREALTQIEQFIRERDGQAGIIYCFSRKNVDDTAKALNARGIPCLPYHAGLGDTVRSENQAAFLAGTVSIMAATLAFGLGIDKPDVRFVIHQDLPKSLEQYYQEIGRAGRDGLPAQALLLYSPADSRKIRWFHEEKSAAEVRKAERALSAMTGWAESSACRRAGLLTHFGETLSAPPAGEPGTDRNEGFPCCDICVRGPAEMTDVTVCAQKFLSCAARTGERYGAAYLIDILLGSRAKRIVENRHHTISTWGIGRELDKQDWHELARTLVEHEYLYREPEYGVLSLTAAARAALSRREPILLPLPAAPFAEPDARQKNGQAGSSIKAFPKPSDALSPALRPEDGRGQVILETLKRLRRELASAAGVAPFMILPDKTLIEIADKKPRDRAGLLKIRGIGEVKAERFGLVLLQAVRQTEE